MPARAAAALRFEPVGGMVRRRVGAQLLRLGARMLEGAGFAVTLNGKPWAEYRIRARVDVSLEQRNDDLATHA